MSSVHKGHTTDQGSESATQTQIVGDCVTIISKFIGSRKIELTKDILYGINRVALVRKWTISTPNVIGKLRINGVVIELDDLDGKVFDMEIIRKQLREILPFTNKDTLLCNIERMLFSNQLVATEHYSLAGKETLWNTIFTASDILVTFDFTPTSVEGLPDIVEVTEEFIFSNTQLENQEASKK